MSFNLAMLFAAAASSAPPPPVVSTNRPTPPAEAVYIADRAAAERSGQSEVAVLGTSHLASLPSDFDRERFAPLLDRLAAWHPRMIAVESLSGAQCDYLKAYAFAYPGTAQTYCFDPAPARQALGLDGPKAEAEIEQLLAASPAARSPEERRRLAMLFLASGDPTSALVQWLRLPEIERKADAVLTAPFAETMVRQARSLNENSLIAATLAARLEHDRVWPVDDHSGDRATGPLAGEAEAAFGRDLTALWDNRWAKARRERYDGWDTDVATGKRDVVSWYRALNAPEAARFAVASDFAAAAADKGERQTGRRYLAYWETRNLRMAANIREAIGPYPGTRILAIVGASHKPYYERYLGVTSDVVIADIASILR